jgi:hypothetical protein
MAMAQQEIEDVAAMEPDESRCTAAVLPLGSAADRAQISERLRDGSGARWCIAEHPGDDARAAETVPQF